MGWFQWISVTEAAQVELSSGRVEAPFLLLRVAGVAGLTSMTLLIAATIVDRRGVTSPAGGVTIRGMTGVAKLILAFFGVTIGTSTFGGCAGSELLPVRTGVKLG